MRLKRLDGDDSNERYIEVCLPNEEKRANPEIQEFSQLSNPFIAESKAMS